MKALQMSRYGAPAEVVQLVDLPEPNPPGPDEVLAAISHAPINQSELLKILGRYPARPPSLPAGVGNEGVARVLAVGSSVTTVKVGDLVVVPAGQPAWCERFVMPASRAIALPAGADPRQLSMLTINPPTAALMLSDFVALAPGDWVIQNAGTSGVGRAVIAIAKSRGLRTVTLVRRPEAVDELRAYGGDVVLADGPELTARVAAATEKAPLKLAIDGVGGESTAGLSACLANGGTVVMYSFTSGKPGAASGIDLIFRDITIRGFWLYAAYPKAVARVHESVALSARLIAEGKLNVPIAATYPLTEARAAFAQAQTMTGGKVLFEIG
jgi:NADPH:quinone reductase-like Zn-dependent oxidoreductase